MYEKDVKIEDLVNEVKDIASELTAKLFKEMDPEYTSADDIQLFMRFMKLTNDSLNLAVKQHNTLIDTNKKLDKVLSHLDEMTALIERGNSDVKYIASNTKFNKN